MEFNNFTQPSGPEASNDNKLENLRSNELSPSHAIVQAKKESLSELLGLPSGSDWEQIDEAIQSFSQVELKKRFITEQDRRFSHYMTEVA
ncbi:MAG: hypothetical protein AAB597_03200 [Patescibacteria group bacterium]